MLIQERSPASQSPAHSSAAHLMLDLLASREPLHKSTDILLALIRCQHGLGYIVGSKFGFTG